MRRRTWLTRLSSAVAAGWSFSRGIGTTYRSFATGILELQPLNLGGKQIAPDGFLRSIRPSAAVADLAEAIWDWDIPDGDSATALTIKVPPSTAPYFVVQYRTLTYGRWQLGAESYDHKKLRPCVDPDPERDLCDSSSRSAWCHHCPAQARGRLPVGAGVHA